MPNRTDKLNKTTKCTKHKNKKESDQGLESDTVIATDATTRVQVPPCPIAAIGAGAEAIRSTDQAVHATATAAATATSKNEVLAATIPTDVSNTRAAKALIDAPNPKSQRSRSNRRAR